MNGNAQEKPLVVSAVVSVARDILVVASERPAPIGSRVSLDLGAFAILPPSESSLSGKVIDVRSADGLFRVTVRLNCTSKAQRQALSAH